MNPIDPPSMTPTGFTLHNWKERPPLPITLKVTRCLLGWRFHLYADAQKFGSGWNLTRSRAHQRGMALLAYAVNL